MKMDRWPFKVLIDGECPLCRREMRFLIRLDVGESARDEDITAAGFDPNPYGATQQELMGQIHGVLPDGVLSREWRSSVTPMTQSAWLAAGAHELAES